MKIVKQPKSLVVRNLDDIIGGGIDSVENNEKLSRHGSVLLPNNIRALICGPSGSGKTNVLLSLIFDPNGLRFHNIYIYSKSLHQWKYQLLKNVLSLVKEVKYYTYDSDQEVLDVSQAKPNSVMIFDDIAFANQKKVYPYFCMGRHKNIDSFYLTQTYTKVPKAFIRDNANLLVLFKQDHINLKHVYDEHVTTDMTFNQFKNICSKCWKNIHGILVIVKDCELNKGRYRKGFDNYIQIETSESAF